VDAARLLLSARRGGGVTQRELAQRAGTSQAALSAYERGVKAPSLQVAERIVEAAGYRLDLVTLVQFTEHTAPGVRPFWVPDRLWRGRLPECFATISVPDPSRYRGVTRFDLRKRPSRRRMYEKLLRRGHPGELVDWVDGALLVDLWDELQIPGAIRQAWRPAVDLARNGPLVHPDYRGAADLD
jgi:transcriptional regulator with XRE-family HTH domain